MNAYELPTSLNIGGVSFSIRTDFRAIIDILIAQNDPNLNTYGKRLVMLKILYENWENIPPEHVEEACRKACEFIDCGQTDDDPGKPKPRLMDWGQDGEMIIPAVNKVANTEVRAAPYIGGHSLAILWRQANAYLIQCLAFVQRKHMVKDLRSGRKSFITITRRSSI